MPAPTRQSLYDFGLPPPAAASPPYLVERTVDASGLIFFRGHGLSLDAPISFRCVSSSTLGDTPSSLPAPLAEGVIYYARPSTPDAFALATAASPASAIAAFTDAAIGRFSWLCDPGAGLDAAIGKAWTVVQSDCTAHGGDVDAPLLTDAAGALAIRLYVAATCAGDPEKAASYDGLTALYAEIYAPKLAAFFSGAPVRGAADADPAVANNGPRRIVLPRGPFRAPCQPGGRAADEDRV